MNKNQFTEITEWQKQTFGQATPLSKLAHLSEELVELLDENKPFKEMGKAKFRRRCKPHSITLTY